MFKNPFFSHIISGISKSLDPDQGRHLFNILDPDKGIRQVVFQNCLIPLGNPFVIPPLGGEGDIDRHKARF